MPYNELLVYLASINDSIKAFESEDKLTTENGLVYVRSREGYHFDGRSWWRRYIWVRW